MRSIRVYLLILVLGAIVPGALVTGALVSRAFTGGRAASERRLLESASVDATAIDREFESTMRILEALATSPALDRNDLEAFYNEGRRVQSTQPSWFTLHLLAPGGQQLISTRQAWRTPLPMAVEPGSLEQLVRTGTPVVGAIRPSLSGDPEYFFPIRVPVRRNGALKFVLTAVVNVESLTGVVPRRDPNSEEWTRSILDAEGTIGVRTRGSENFIGTRATDAFLARLRNAPDTVLREVTREGDPVYAATSRGRYGWTAVVVVPTAVLDAPVRESTTGILVGGALLMVGGLAAILIVSRRLSGDINAASAAAAAVADGRAVEPRGAHLSETSRLLHSLTSAASLLESRARERDEQVRRADAARADAEEANRAKNQFLAVLGHELRNPLAPAATAIELMKMRNPTVFTREREVLERQVKHMTRLVNDLLDVSRLERGLIALDRARIDLRDVIDQAVDMARPLFARRGQSFRVSIEPGLMVHADLDRMVQALSNVLTNAAKYAPSGGHVALTAIRTNDRAVIACEDDGPGVPQDVVPRLFTAFAQGPRALDGQQGGLGLGLALARTFVALHEGSIYWEARQPGPGSRFVMSLPLAPTALQSVSEPQPDAASSQRHRILLVDDNADASDMLRIGLLHLGHELEVATNGHDAIAAARRFRPEVAILDIGLPDMNGYELAHHLRVMYPEAVLIALTGYGQTSDIAAAMAAGFDAHCSKPVSMSELVAHMARPASEVPSAVSSLNDSRPH